VSGLQTQVRAGTAQVAVAGGGAATAGGAAVRQVTAQLARGGQIVRQGGQTSLIVSQQPRQALAVQRPLLSGQAVGVVARSVARPAGGGQIMMATSPAGVRAAGGQIMVQGNLQRAVPGQLVMASTGQLRQGGVMVVTTSTPAGSAAGAGGVIVQSTAASGATRQHYVISSSQAGGQAQIVALTPGQTVRPGQIVQVAGQQGQHQIVVSSSGQIVLQPPTSKQL